MQEWGVVPVTIFYLCESVIYPDEVGNLWVSCFGDGWQGGDGGNSRGNQQIAFPILWNPIVICVDNAIFVVVALRREKAEEFNENRIILYGCISPARFRQLHILVGSAE